MFSLTRTPDRGIGLMCGTSRDALDICDVQFTETSGKIEFIVHNSKAVELPPALIEAFGRCEVLSGRELMTLDRDFARFCAEGVNRFVKETDSKAGYLASHGATVFHQPQKGITVQLGSGAILASLCAMPVVSDFRSQDVAKQGQGAPLVPLADLHLFSGYTYFLNLGGFANVSRFQQNVILGYDVSPCNLVLNAMANHLGLRYDENGAAAARGKLIAPMLAALNELPFYQMLPPKSLGTEWLVSSFWPLIQAQLEDYRIEDILHTLCEHIAIQIGRQLQLSNTTCLCTGGGAHNAHLISRIRQYSSAEIMVPSNEIINFKESIAFAYLGWLRLLGKVNTLKSVTGASSDTCAGAVYLP